MIPMSSAYQPEEARDSELEDELGAINSIYGDCTLVPSQDEAEAGNYILALPNRTSSLRLHFPRSYPAEPPTVLGTHSSGEHAKRGDALRDLDLFRRALGTVYEPGQVCLFDAIEELARLVESYAEEEDVVPMDRDGRPHFLDETTANNTAKTGQAREDSQVGGQGPPPPWVPSDPVIEMKSTFIARCASVASPHQANQFLQHLLASDKRVRTATHNITAWRIKGPNNTSFQDCNDDGETAAGGRLLHLMQLMDLWDTMVVVTRWYGGQKLGPRRFAVINQVARDAFSKAGLVAEAPSKKKSQGKS